MLQSIDKKGYDSIESLEKLQTRSISPNLHRSPIHDGKLRKTQIDEISEASYQQYLTAEQIGKGQILRHQTTSPINRKLQSPQPQQIHLSTNQTFIGETTKSSFPTMPRKKLKNPDRIRQIFVENRKGSVTLNGNGRATAKLSMKNDDSIDRLNITA